MESSMKTIQMVLPETLNPTMIAPCGMNCIICSAYLRERKPCPGCNGDDVNKPQDCVQCSIKNCDEMKDHEPKFCFVCDRLPCTRLRQLDKRYRTKHGMSMIENLESIKQLGLEGFVTREKDRWKCPECGGVI
jgi:hypothetical protein